LEIVIEDASTKLVNISARSIDIKFVFFISIEKMESHTLIIGLGNELMGDEGIGVHSIEYLRDKEIP
jgi:hypothetical protein